MHAFDLFIQCGPPAAATAVITARQLQGRV